MDDQELEQGTSEKKTIEMPAMIGLILVAAFDDVLNVIADTAAFTGVGLVVYAAIRITTFFISAFFLAYFIMKFKWQYLGMRRGVMLIIGALFDEVGVPTRTIMTIIMIMSLRSQLVKETVGAIGSAGKGMASATGRLRGEVANIAKNTELKAAARGAVKKEFETRGLDVDRFSEDAGKMKDAAIYSARGIAQKYLKETPGTKYEDIIKSDPLPEETTKNMALSERDRNIKERAAQDHMREAAKARLTGNDELAEQYERSAGHFQNLHARDQEKKDKFEEYTQGGATTLKPDMEGNKIDLRNTA